MSVTANATHTVNKVNVETDIKNEATSIAPVEVKFHEDTIPAFVANDGTVYAAVKQILLNIGFNEERIHAIRTKWRDDEVVSKGNRNFNYLTNGGMQIATFMSTKILPLALAKITITPTLKKEYPVVVEKLVKYQLECADVLYKHFFQNKTDVKEPVIYEGDQIYITREELTFYFASFADGINNFLTNLSSLVNGIADGNKAFIASIDKRLDVMEQSHQEAFSAINNRSEKLESSLSKAMWKISSNIQTPVINTVNKKSLNPHLVNTISTSDTKQWLSNAWKSADIIGKCSGHQKNYVMRELCNGLREKGVDFDSLWDEYHSLNRNKDAKINMIAESDYLRPLAENVFRELHKKYLSKIFDNKDESESPKNKAEKDEANHKVYKSQLLLRTPAEVRELIEKVAARNNWLQHVAAAFVYKEIESRTNKNLKELASKYAEKLGFTNCCKAYYISKNKKMMEILRDIAEGK